MDATTVLNIFLRDHFLWITSIEKIVAANGAIKTAEKPAAAALPISIW
jgi:hypothetical protein